MIELKGKIRSTADILKKQDAQKELDDKIAELGKQGIEMTPVEEAAILRAISLKTSHDLKKSLTLLKWPPNQYHPITAISKFIKENVLWGKGSKSKEYWRQHGIMVFIMWPTNLAWKIITLPITVPSNLLAKRIQKSQMRSERKQYYEKSQEDLEKFLNDAEKYSKKNGRPLPFYSYQLAIVDGAYPGILDKKGDKKGASKAKKAA